MPIQRFLGNLFLSRLGLFLVHFPAAVAGLLERMKDVWAISFEQPRNVYHNCFPFTATMCVCAQFTVVVFLRGLWYGFIGCSRCPFGYKCIYLYRSVYTCILESACVFFIYCNILELSFPKNKTTQKIPKQHHHHNNDNNKKLQQKQTTTHKKTAHPFTTPSHYFFYFYVFFPSNYSFILLFFLYTSFKPCCWGFFPSSPFALFLPYVLFSSFPIKLLPLLSLSLFSPFFSAFSPML